MGKSTYIILSGFPDGSVGPSWYPKQFLPFSLYLMMRSVVFSRWEWEPLSGQFLIVHSRPLHEVFSCFSPNATGLDVGDALGSIGLQPVHSCTCDFSTWVRPKEKARCQHQAHHWAESWAAAPRAAQNSLSSMVLKLCLVLRLLSPKLRIIGVMQRGQCWNCSICMFETWFARQAKEGTERSPSKTGLHIQPWGGTVWSMSSTARLRDLVTGCHRSLISTVYKYINTFNTYITPLDWTLTLEVVLTAVCLPEVCVAQGWKQDACWSTRWAGQPVDRCDCGASALWKIQSGVAEVGICRTCERQAEENDVHREPD